MHQLIIAKITNLLGKAGIGYHVYWAAPLLVVSVVAAWLLFEFVEKPFERRLRPQHGLSVSTGGAGHLVETS
ncbi:MAG TPA: hypothetical protein VHV75_18415 [Solirubrobacteraceae bacterium]|nr:hypothetical protein [Solirubrobacteraceae bacterium]